MKLTECLHMCNLYAERKNMHIYRIYIYITQIQIRRRIYWHITHVHVHNERSESKQRSEGIH